MFAVPQRKVSWAAIASACRGIVFAILLVVLTTLALVAAFGLVELRHIAMVFIVPVVIAALRWGVISALAACAASMFVSAFFFYEPIYSVQVHDPLQLVDLVLFCFVGIVTGHLAAKMRRQAAIARQREQEIADLYAFSRRLAVAHGATEIYSAIQQHLSSLLRRRVVLFHPSAKSPASTDDAGAPYAIKEAATAIADGLARARDGKIIDDGAGNLWLVRAVTAATPDYGAIAVDLGPPTKESEAEIRARIEPVLADAALTLEHLGIASALSEARMRAETDRFREALVGSVSHELRTPLASILGTTTLLAGAPAVQGEARLAALANVAREEAERLNRDIQKLLDATRISSNGVQPKFEWTEPIDIVNSAIERSRTRLAEHVLEVVSPDDLPIVYVDSVLVEQALGQIIDNAGKYSQAGSTVRIEGRCENGDVVLAVSDQGDGVLDEERAQLAERFFRGKRHVATTNGTGLGLWIAQAFLAANGARLDVTNRNQGQGTTVSIRLPVPRQQDSQMGALHD